MRWSALQETLRRNQRFDFVAPAPLASNAIKAMLQYSATLLADDAGVQYDALTQGTGLVNGLGAISLAFYADTQRASGSFWLTTTVPPLTTFGDTHHAWSESMIWGTRLVTGSSIVELNQVAWADNIVWGTNLLGFFDGDNIVWGTFSEDNIVWGTNDDGVTVLGSSLIGGGL